MSTLINPCTHLVTCEPCCPIYTSRDLADLEASVEMTLVVVTGDTSKRRFTYALPPNADAIFLTDAAKEMFLWPYAERRRQTEWPKGYDPKKHPPLNGGILVEL
jgi:hypothetical protein